MAEYIERAKVLEEASKCGLAVFNEFIKLPKADVAPVRHGRWVYSTTYRDADTCLCSECEQMMTTHHGERMPFCPGCGATMDGGAENA